MARGWIGGGMGKGNIETGKPTDLLPDDINANTGTVRGTAMLERSIEDYGCGRSIVTDKNLTAIGGNKTLEAAVGVGVKETILVHTTGEQLVVVVRDDLDLSTDARARELAVADNRVSEVNLTWAVDMLQKIEGQGAMLDKFFTPKETEILLQQSLAFVPETNPEFSNKEVTDGEISSVKDRLGSKFSDVASESARAGREVVCPGCGKAFVVSGGD
jgi:hypothetical protein